MKKLLAIDMDGTLLNTNNSVSQEQMIYLEGLSEREDIQIAITTGRPLPGVKNLISHKLFENTYIIGSNGGFIYSKSEGVISQNTFTLEEINEIAEIGVENNVSLVLSDMNNFFAVTKEYNKITEFDASINKIKPVMKNKDFLNNANEISRIVYFFEPNLQNKIVESIPEDYFEKYNIVLSQPYLIDFLTINTDKSIH